MYGAIKAYITRGRANPFRELSKIVDNTVKKAKPTTSQLSGEVTEVVCTPPRDKKIRLFVELIYDDKKVPKLTATGILHSIDAIGDKRSLTVTPFSHEDSLRVENLVPQLPANRVDVLCRYPSFVEADNFAVLDHLSNSATQRHYEAIHEITMGLTRELGVTRSWRIAEPGCERRAGLSTAIAREMGASVFASDIHPEIVGSLKATNNLPNLHFGNYPVQQLHMQHNFRFDLVLASGLFNRRVMDNEKDVLDGLHAVWEATAPGGYVIMTGLTPLLVRSDELRKMGFNILRSSIPELLFAYGKSPYNFYVMERGGAWSYFNRPDHLEYFQEMIIPATAKKFS